MKASLTAIPTLAFGRSASEQGRKGGSRNAQSWRAGRRRNAGRKEERRKEERRNAGKSQPVEACRMVGSRKNLK